jgi:DNA-binding NarL/FixJ family response regulator
MHVGERPRTIRIMIVEDHASIRQALAHMLNLEPRFSVVSQAGSLAEAREAMEEVDVVILDLGLPDGNGIELLQDLHDLKQDTMVLVLSASTSYQQYALAIEEGAAAVMHKSTSMDEIIDAIHCLDRGETLLSVTEVVEVFRAASRRSKQEREAKLAVRHLSEREKDVLRALADGLSSTEIAQRLNITIATERSHFLRIFTKLGVHSRLQALILALRYGVVEI